MKKVSVTVNISFKYPATDKKLSAIIKSGKPEKNISAYIRSVPRTCRQPPCLRRKVRIELPDIREILLQRVEKIYPNHELKGFQPAENDRLHRGRGSLLFKLARKILSPEIFLPRRSPLKPAMSSTSPRSSGTGRSACWIIFPYLI